MRRAPRSGTRRGRTAAPGARAGGPRTAGDRERAERKRQRPRSGASGSQPGRRGRRRAAEATGERAPLAKPGRNARAHRRSPAHRPEWAEHGATGPGGGRGAGPRIGQSPLRGAPSAAGTRTGKVRKLSWILGGVEGLRHSTPPRCSLFIVHAKDKNKKNVRTMRTCRGEKEGRLTSAKRPVILATGARIRSSDTEICAR